MVQKKNMKKEDRIEFYPQSRKEWRNWLKNNYKTTGHVWLILYKKQSGKPTITYDEVVEEALCFGWIDSKPNKKDDESYFLFVCPRKPNSVWSALNKKRIEKLVKEKLMTPAGLEKINAAKKNGSWNLLNNSDALKMPVALQKAFAKNIKSLKNFEQFPPSTKKQIIQWIESAKTEETIAKRVTETVTQAAKNIRANQWQPKQ